MRSKTVTRYYCDHCNKGMLQKPAMARHEETCFKNPERVCVVCGSASNIKALEVKLELSDNKSDEELVRYYMDYCPACIMAFQIQHAEFWIQGFDYQEEMKEWNNERAQY